MADLDKTIIRFKFLKPGGFSISGHGNFNPRMQTVLDKEASKIGVGNVWVPGFDLENDTYEIELDSENLSELPDHIKNSADETTQTAFKERQASKAADQFEKNNEKRKELAYHESTGLIKIVYDSFYDGKGGRQAQPPKAPRAPKATKQLQQAEAPAENTPDPTPDPS